MSVSPRLREFLDRHGATYQVLADSSTHPARGAPHPRREVAKVVVIRHGGGLSLAVLPAQSRVDLDRLGAALREDIVPATETEIATAFPDYEPGAIPPIGILDGLKTYLDESLTHDRQIAFSAGSRDAVIRMAIEDYRRVAAPVVLWFAESPARAGD
jgi:Ala-tRNA(Pro) deacylase